MAPSWVSGGCRLSFDLRRNLLAVAIASVLGCSEGAEVTLWLADPVAGCVQSFDGSGEPLLPPIDAHSVPHQAYEHSFRPSSMVPWGDVLVVANFDSGELMRFDPTSGAWLGNLGGDWRHTVLEEPVGLQAHGDQLVVVGNDSWNLIVLDEVLGAADLERPVAACLGPDGELFVLDARGVLRFDQPWSHGSDLLVDALARGLHFPRDLRVIRDGRWQ